MVVTALAMALRQYNTRWHVSVLNEELLGEDRLLDTMYTRFPCV